MKTKTIINTLILAILTTAVSMGQAVEEETGFQYVKGNYLFDSGRFDEAIQIYNEIVKGAPDYEEVLIYRARAKYALGAYKGAKKDGLRYIELNGLSDEVCLIMGQAELGLGNPLVAISYLDYSVMENSVNAEALLFRGNAYFEIEEDVAACTDWHKAKRLGSDRASQKTATYCSRIAIPIEDEKPEVVVDNGDDVLDDGEVLSTETEAEAGNDSSTREEEDVLSGDEVLSSDDLEEDETETPASDEVASNSEDDYIFENSDDDLDAEFPDDDPVFDEPLDIVVEIIEVDEDLDIKLYDGIGSREVREVPDILILSDKSGQVVVNICVDESGNVASATLNRKKSTVGSAGLISLALRKSREFKFERKRGGEQCGKIAFMIKG